MASIDEIGNLDTAYTHYVSPSGYNNTFKPYRKGWPARSIAYVLSNYAKPGDTIRILPGEYNDARLLKNGVHLFAEHGAIVHNTAVEIPIFSSASDGADGNVAAKILGWGTYIQDCGNADSSANHSVFRLANAGDNLYVEALEIRNKALNCDSNGTQTQPCCIFARQGTGVFRVKGDIVSENFTCISTPSGGSSVNLTVSADRLMAAQWTDQINPSFPDWPQAGQCVQCYVGTLDITSRIMSANDAVINAGGATLVVRADSMQSASLGMDTVANGGIVDIQSRELICVSDCLVFSNTGTYTIRIKKISGTVAGSRGIVLGGAGTYLIECDTVDGILSAIGSSANFGTAKLKAREINGPTSIILAHTGTLYVNDARIASSGTTKEAATLVSGAVLITQNVSLLPSGTANCASGAGTIKAFRTDAIKAATGVTVVGTINVVTTLV